MARGPFNTHQGGVMVGDALTDDIAPDDRVTYAEAAEITQRSPGYLLKLVNAGRLSRMGGHAAYRTFLSRTAGRSAGRPGLPQRKAGSYWITMTQVADLAGVHRTGVHQDHQSGRLTAFQTPADWLVRLTDAQQAVPPRPPAHPTIHRMETTTGDETPEWLYGA